MNFNKNSIVKGKLRVANSVVKKIIEETIKDIDGVASLEPLPLNFTQFILRPDQDESIKIKMIGETISITIGICVYMGKPVKSICEEIQNQVKSAVQDMTGLTVSKLDILVNNVIVENLNNEEV